MGETISFTDIPFAVQELLHKVESIQQLQLENSHQNEYQDQWFSIDDLCDYLPGHPAKATLYAKVKQHHIQKGVNKSGLSVNGLPLPIGSEYETVS